MILRVGFFKKFCGALLILVVSETQVNTAVAQFDFESSYEVAAEVSVVKNNFVQAREKAVKIALKSALEQELRAFLGDEEFEYNFLEMQKMLRKSEKYVKSYRFLEAKDDPIKLVSQVKLEVILFQDAVNNYLSRKGVAMGLDEGKQVVVLINESGLSSDSQLNFWEAMPISETSITRNFIEAGIPVVKRAFIRYAIPEKVIMKAVKGDISAAVNIGLKAGADVVIVGNATSVTLDNVQLQGPQPVRVAISLKAVSSYNSMLIAAKSDFATVSRNEVFASELEAFHRAGSKLTEFLIPAIETYWQVGDAKKEAKQIPKQLTPAQKLDSSPLPWGDF